MRKINCSVRSLEDAARTLSYFNNFHDSFMETLSLSVIPESSEEFGFGLQVRYDAVLIFVHANYPAAMVQEQEQEARRVKFRLTNIQSLNIGDIVPLDNMLQSCLLEVREDGTIYLDVGGDGILTFLCRKLVIEEL